MRNAFYWFLVVIGIVVCKNEFTGEVPSDNRKLVPNKRGKNRKRDKS